MKPQPYNRKKRFSFELNRTQMIISIAGALFILCWVFILGIIVGRGYVSDTISRAFSDQIQKLQQEKKALMDKYLAQEKKGDGPQAEILKPQLDFYDKLSQKDSGNTLMTAPTPTPKPLSGEGKAEATNKTASPETQKESKETQPEAKIFKESPASPGETEGFMVQIGSYREEATAQSGVKRLQGKGYQAYLKAKEIPQKGGKWFRVQIGPLKTRLEAEKMVKKLAHDGFQAVVLENNP